MSDADFRIEQRGVRRGMAAAALITAALFALIWRAPAGLALEGTLDARLRLASGAALVPALVLALCVGRIAAARYLDPAAIAGAAADLSNPRLRAPQAILANSVEQTLVALPVWFALSLLLPPERLFAIPALAALHAAGRAAFALRYAGGAAARALGFALTFYPSLAGLALAAALALR